MEKEWKEMPYMAEIQYTGPDGFGVCRYVVECTLDEMPVKYPEVAAQKVAMDEFMQSEGRLYDPQKWPRKYTVQTKKGNQTFTVYLQSVMPVFSTVEVVRDDVEVGP